MKHGPLRHGVRRARDSKEAISTDVGPENDLSIATEGVPVGIIPYPDIGFGTAIGFITQFQCSGAPAI